MAHEVKLILPVSVVGQIDLGRLIRELEAINEAMLQLKLRSHEQNRLPRSTQQLDELVKSNQLNLLREEDRTQLADFLKSLKTQAPIIHMSFSASPSPTFLDKLITHLRQKFHPYILLTVGLQPTIGAGCILRTTNKYFDLSLKQSFLKHRQLLIEKLMPAAPAPQTAVADAASAPAQGAQ